MELTQALPCFIGGALVSSAIGINRRYGKIEAQPVQRSFFNYFTITAGTRLTATFIAGMLFAAIFAANIFGLGETKFLNIKPFESEKAYFQGTSLLQCMIGAFLIGMGTRLAKENLSKYAFYGLPPFSRQSIACALFAFFVAVITATFRSSIPILQGLNLSKKFSETFDFRLPFLIPVAMLLISVARHYKSTNDLKDIFISFGIGSWIATGMMIGGLTKRHLVLDFLSFNKNWNPSLLFFFIGAFACDFLLSQILPSVEMPVGTGMPSTVGTSETSGMSTGSAMPSTFGTSESTGMSTGSAMPSTSRTIPMGITGLMSPKTLLGCILFGVGKGMTGLALGSALLVSPIYFPHATLFVLPSILAGQFVGGLFDKFTTRSMKGTKEL